MNKQRVLSAVAVGALLIGAPNAHADSVAQVSTSKRISAQTVTLIDPQGRVVAGGGGSDTVAQPGDILTFIISFTPVPNGAVRGLGGYITDYIPGNTEVVGARLIDRNGNTVTPHRGGLADDGYGPRGKIGYTAPLVEGSVSQLYADTGIFYSTDARTARQPTGANANEAFLSLTNGLAINPVPTGANMLATILNSGTPYYAHNQWDLTQAVAFGANSGGIDSKGVGNASEHTGNAGIGYGSPVAGPETWYQLEATYNSALGATITNTTVQAQGKVGPWHRIRTTGGEIGRRGNVPPMAQGLPARVGIPALDGTGLPLGYDLNPDHPLPAGTNAVRFALGELVVGDEYFAEISLRVKALPLDPVSGQDINCAEVTGGDASSRDDSGGTGGKDNVWRYFLPAPSCVLLNLAFEDNVNKVLAVSGDSLTYTINGKNLSTATQQNVKILDCYDPSEVTFVSATGGGTVDTTAAGCPNAASQDAVVWNVGSLAPGASFSFTVNTTAKGSTALNRAVFTSTALPSPGFVTGAFTDIKALTVIRLAGSASPSYVSTLPSTVHYTTTVTNVGTAAATAGNGYYLDVVLPTGFSYAAGTAKVNGAAVANPTITGQLLKFGSGIVSIAPGATLTLTFDANVAGGTAAGLYTIDFDSYLKDGGFGQDVADAVARIAPVAVLTPRSDVPTVTTPIAQGSTTVKGTTAEAAGAVVRVYVNGNPVGSGTSTAGGTFSVTVPTLYAGQRVTVTVQATGELEGLPSSPVVVAGVSGKAACNDGKDNDGDGKCDFGGCTITGVPLPADPGCTSASDPDETDVPQCSDGIDNDGDGKIDFPADEGCSSLLDNTEVGLPACSDGVDNDGDGKVDFPADPGCASANDVNEDDVPQCADGIDNDGDGKIDFPADPGCSSSVDDDETDATSPAVDMSAIVDMSVIGIDDMGVGQVRPDGMPPNPGGVPDDGSESGCGCTIGTAQRGGNGWMASLALCGFIVLQVRRRRRRP